MAGCEGQPRTGCDRCPSVSFLEPSGESAWDKYVAEHSQGTPFHLLAWREAVERTFGHRPHYLVAKAGADVVGVLPVFHVKSFLFGSMLVSVPYGVYGGALADSEQTALALEGRAAQLAGELSVAYLELRDRQPAAERGGAHRELYVGFRKELPADSGAVLETIPRKTRRMVRLAISAGLDGALSRSPEHVDAFYSLFAHNMRKLGSPAFPKSLILNLLSSFKDRADILLVRREGRPVAGVMNLYFGDQVLPYYSGAQEELNSIGVNNFLYYDLMVKSIEKGYRLFDFGRSKIETGPYHFKRHFGFEPKPLPYRYVLIRGTEIPNLNPTNPKYRRAIEIWKKLPLRITTTVGPWIVRGIP